MGAPYGWKIRQTSGRRFCFCVECSESVPTFIRAEISNPLNPVHQWGEITEEPNEIPSGTMGWVIDDRCPTPKLPDGFMDAFLTLDLRAKEIIVRRFIRNETLEAISKDFGCTREYIRVLEAAALKKLRVRLANHAALTEVGELTESPDHPLEDRELVISILKQKRAELQQLMERLSKKTFTWT